MSSDTRLVLLTEEAVSEWLSVPVATLRTWRAERVHLPFIQVSARKVRYDEAGVIAYLKSKEVATVKEVTR